MYLIKKIILFFVLYIPISHGRERIVGGIETTIEKRPYIASLQYTSSGVFPYCGAIIVSTRHLLSAAQCHPGDNLKTLYARIGSTAHNTGGQFFKISDFVIHPNFDKDTLDYDFAILPLQAGPQIELGPTAAIIPLASTTNLADGSLVTVSGWGLLFESASSIPINLREVDMPVVNFDVCKRTFDNLTPRQLCLGGTAEGYQSACMFDTGGPAVQNGTLYGLVSGVRRCGEPNIPGLFSKVSEVKDWIDLLIQ